MRTQPGSVIPQVGHFLIIRFSTQSSSAPGDTKIVPPRRCAGKSGYRFRYRLTVLTLTPSAFATSFFPTSHSLNGISSVPQIAPEPSNVRCTLSPSFLRDRLPPHPRQVGGHVSRAVAPLDEHRDVHAVREPFVGEIAPDRSRRFFAVLDGRRGLDQRPKLGRA